MNQTETIVSQEKKGPYKKSRIGKFQISLFHNSRIIPADEEKGRLQEREVQWERSCVQFSRKIQGEWQRQEIWCSPGELRDLANALDALNS
jgi:hypothetical protein